jgi:hypothetical protein
MKNRTELTERFISSWLDGLDWKDLYMVAYEQIEEKMKTLTDEQVLAEIEMISPELLETEEE